MALDASTFTDDEPIERRPGDFYRSKAGTPYVSDPSGAVVKSGPRKGEPKRIPYGRPSGFGKQIEDGYALAKYGERKTAHGIGVDYADATSVMAMPELAARCAQLVNLDPDSAEYRTLADAIVVDAKRIAQAGIAAERGTHSHSLTEDNDTERDWIVRAETGEVLGLDRSVQQSLVDAWRAMLEREGLEILATELPVVHDGYRMAGTLDRIAQLTKPLRFAKHGGEIVELDAGTVVVLDIKTGKRRLDRNGLPMYWQSYAVQIHVYASSLPYLVDTETRGVFSWLVTPDGSRIDHVDQRYGLIAHLDVLGAIDGNPSCELILVDLEAGRHAAELCLAAKAWEKRSDVFSVANISTTTPEVVDEQQSAVVGAPQSTAAPAPTDKETQCSTTTSTTSTTTSTRSRTSTPTNSSSPSLAPSTSAPASSSTDATTAPVATTASSSPGTAPIPGSSSTPSSPTTSSFTSTPEPTQQELHARLRIHPNIDEGAVDDPQALDAVFKRMETHYLAMPAEARLWAANLQVEAQRHGCGFHAREAHTLRRFELIRGLIALGAAGLDNNDLVRCAVAHVTGDDVALFPSIAAGHALGSLDAAEAAQFSATCDQLVADLLVLVFSEDGQPRLVTRPAA